MEVTVVTTSGRRLEAVASTEHAASCYGLPVLVVANEAVGAADMLPIHEGGALCGVDAIARVETTDPALREALARAGYPVREPEEEP